MNKLNWKAEQRQARRSVRRLCGQGLAVSMSQVTSFALLASIHDDPTVQSELESINQAIDLLDNTFRNQETQDCVFDLGKYSANIHTLRPCALLNDLANENNPLAESLAIGMNKAENEARNF